MIDFSIPLGMNVAAGTVNAAATRLAEPAASQTSGPANDIVSLSAGEAGAAVSAKEARVEADIEQTLIDIFG